MSTETKLTHIDLVQKLRTTIVYMLDTMAGNPVLPVLLEPYNNLVSGRAEVAVDMTPEEASATAKMAQIGLAHHRSPSPEPIEHCCLVVNACTGLRKLQARAAGSPGYSQAEVESVRSSMAESASYFGEKR